MKPTPIHVAEVFFFADDRTILVAEGDVQVSPGSVYELVVDGARVGRVRLDRELPRATEQSVTAMSTSDPTGLDAATIAAASTIELRPI